MANENTIAVVSRDQVAAALKVSLVTLWRMEKRGDVPPSIRISPGRVGWRVLTLQRWLEKKEAAVRRSD